MLFWQTLGNFVFQQSPLVTLKRIQKVQKLKKKIEKNPKKNSEKPKKFNTKKNWENL